MATNDGHPSPSLFPPKGTEEVPSPPVGASSFFRAKLDRRIGRNYKTNPILRCKRSTLCQHGQPHYAIVGAFTSDRSASSAGGADLKHLHL